MKKATRKIIRDYGMTFAIALVIALLIRAWVFEVYRIPSPAMRPTLEPGDTLFVTKWGNGRLQYGDVVLYEVTPPGTPLRPLYIRRVLGLPGDTVEIKKGVVFLNGKSLASGTLPDSPTTCFQEILPGAKSILVCREPPLLERFGPERVPDGHVFVLGDLRSQALHETPKSRVWGMIPNSTLRGLARWIWISTVPESRLAGAITSFPRIRFERILRKIE